MTDLTPDEARMVEDNIGLVHMFLRRWGVPQRDYDDRFQDAMIGLCTAVRKFDPAKGYRFSTYAENWIRQAVARGRGRFEGVDYRRAVDSQRGGVYIPPVSLDEPFGDDDDRSRVEFAAADDDPAEAACDRVMADELYDACRDDLDRAALIGKALGVPDLATARQFGVSAATIAYRRARIARTVAA